MTYRSLTILCREKHQNDLRLRRDHIGTSFGDEDVAKESTWLLSVREREAVDLDLFAC